MGKILIIDDSQFICKSIENILKGEDMEMLFSNTGKDAIEKIKNEIPDLILLDINLPDIDGYSFCRYIKSNKSLKHIPIIFITSISDSSNIVKAFEVGGIDYVNKPFCEQELKARVKAHLKNKLMTDELQETNKKLLEVVEINKKLATTDYLTNLYNRRYLLVEMKSIYSISNKTEVSSMIICDIDKFKRINDTYGHIVGDKVIVNTSKIIQECSGTDAVVGRLGGEEFIIVLKDKDINTATLIAEKIRKSIEENSITVENEEIEYTITLGVSEINFDLTVEENINIADKRLYIGKENGRNCVINCD